MISLALARQISNQLLKQLIIPAKWDIMHVGSIRRENPLIKDIDFLIIVPKIQDYKIRFEAGLIKIHAINLDGQRHKSFTINYKNIKCLVDLFFATEKEKPFAMFHYTGSRLYNIRTRATAKKYGWKLNQYGLFYANNNRGYANINNNINNINNINHNINNNRSVRGSKLIKTEKQLAKFLSVSYRLPFDREK